MSTLEGFAPIISKHAKVLILGSMPGEASLIKQQYYGHPRNAFWPIMNALFTIDPDLCYLERKQALIENNIAIWDVLKCCKRQGSLDSQIVTASIITNRFDTFFSEYSSIQQVYFNGLTAEKLYRKYSLPTLIEHFSYIQYHRLPSSSPAHASLNLAQKIEAWQIVKRSMLK
jgi:double-stranded uracil-DNA glycosylase